MRVNAGACAHCGALVSAGETFCCRGCATAFSLLAECGLGGQAQLRLAAVAAGAAPHPVPVIIGEWDGWETTAFLDRHAVLLADGSRALTWSVEGMHCPACVWVLERLPFIDSGVRSATVDLGRGVLRTIVDPTQTDARRLTQTAAMLGYRLRPWAAGADARRQGAARALLLRAAVAFACAVGAMQLAMNLTAGELTGDLEPAARLLFGSGAVLLALPAATWAVGPWWLALWRAIRYGRWSLDATAAVVVAVGLGSSVLNLARGSYATYADAVAMFCALLLAGRVVLARVQDQLAVQGSHLSGLLPDQPPVLGDVLKLIAGQRLPADGTVVECAAAALDGAVLTGESQPVTVRSGQQVEAGMLVVQGTLSLRVERSGSDTRVAHLLARAEADAAGRLPPGISSWERWYGLALVGLALLAAPWGIERMVAVVMAACPCAIGLAVPLARARVLVAARARGVLLPSAETLVRLRGIRRVVLDKTGTVTTGRPTVVAWDWLVEPALRPRIAGAVAAAERGCRHPLALAIATHLTDAAAVEVEQVRERPVVGVSAICTGVPFTVGPDGQGGIDVRWNGELAARIQVVDGLRPEAAAFVALCRTRGLDLVIASGDAPAPVAEVSVVLGISATHAQLTPEGKAALVDDMTLMIGDGVNDALALGQAGVGIAVRGGLAAGLATADAVITDLPAPLTAVGELLRASDRLARRERALLLLTVGYNAVAVSCALAGLWGPLICAIGMPLSSLAAVLMASQWRPFPALNPKNTVGS